MKIRTLLGAMLGIGLVATMTTAGGGSAASATADPGPLVAAGTVRSASGEPLSGVLVVARTEHDEGGRKAQIELARDTTDEAGEFELEGTLQQPADRNADGSVRIEIMALTTDVVRYQLVDVLPPVAPGGDWKSSRATSDQPMGGLELTLPAGTRADAREAQLARACPSFADIYWKETSTTVKRAVPVHFAYVANKTKHKFEYETTTSTDLSVAYTGVGKNYSGGLTGSEQNDTSAGLIGTKGAGSPYTPFLWKLQWLYRKEDKWCFNAGYPYAMGRSRWLPVKWTGGNWVSHDATTFPCDPDNRAGSGHDFWVQRHTASTWTGWFSIGGVRLSSSQERGSRIKGTYLLRRGMGRMVLCGKDDVPPSASFVEEVAST